VRTSVPHSSASFFAAGAFTGFLFHDEIHTSKFLFLEDYIFILAFRSVLF
jgi:hypothetical protein